MGPIPKNTLLKGERARHLPSIATGGSLTSSGSEGMAESTASPAHAADHAAADKFDARRAAEYDRQARIALAGYEAMHELTACCLAAALGTGTEQSLLIVGVGTGQEIATIGRHQPR